MRVSVWVKPGSKKGPLIIDEGTRLVVYVKQRAIEGEANQAVLALLAQHFGVKDTKISLVSGSAARIKIFEISGI